MSHPSFADFKPLALAEGAEAGGISYYWKDTEDGAEILGVQDVAPILEMNRAMFNENDGWSASGEFKRAASIPAIVIEQWLAEGIDVFNPRHGDRVAKKLNDPDWRYLRTAGGHLAALPDGGFR